jgi:hypothetical protein
LIIGASLKEYCQIVNEKLMPQNLLLKLTKGHNSGKNGRKKKYFLRSSRHRLNPA